MAITLPFPMEKHYYGIYILVARKKKTKKGFTSTAGQEERNTSPVGKGANDLAQLAFTTSKLSEITTDPSAPMPQKSFTPSSAPYPPYTQNDSIFS